MNEADELDGCGRIVGRILDKIDGSRPWLDEVVGWLTGSLSDADEDESGGEDGCEVMI